jgi:hypothetical protein
VAGMRQGVLEDRLLDRFRYTVDTVLGVKH